MSGKDIIIEQLRADVARLEAERDEARANYAFMVERAADQKLDGYRELGARAAAAEERAEKAERERDEARAERDEALRRRTRAERVGEAVLDIGFTVDDAKAVRTIYSWAGNDASRIVNCMRAIADALKEDGNAAG